MESKKIRVAIIGANSYIARNLIKIIDMSIYNVSLYDYQKESVDCYENYKQVDLIDRASVEQIDVDCEVIYLFSGMTGTSIGFQRADDFIDLNEKGLINLLNLLVDKKSSAKIIFPSTRLVYKGQENTLLTEESEKEFKTIYAMNKYACEKYLEMYRRTFNIKYCIFRICIPYGNIVSDMQSYGTIEFFLSKARKGQDIEIYGDGTQRRSFIHIVDLCNILLRGATQIKCENEIFNVGGPDNLSIFEVAHKIAQIFNVGVKFIEWPDMTLALESGDTIFDSSKIENILEYNYEYSYDLWIREYNNRR